MKTNDTCDTFSESQRERTKSKLLGDEKQREMRIFMRKKRKEGSQLKLLPWERQVGYQEKFSR